MKLSMKESFDQSEFRNQYVRGDKNFIQDYISETVEYMIDNYIDPEFETIAYQISDDLAVDDNDEFGTISVYDLANRIIKEYERQTHTDGEGEWGILCKNRGMWGGMESWLKHHGKTVRFRTEEEARKYAQELRDSQGRVNNFNSYFVKKI